MLGKIAGPIQWFWRYARKGSNFWYYYHYISSSNMDVYAAALRRLISSNPLVTLKHPHKGESFILLGVDWIEGNVDTSSLPTKTSKHHLSELLLLRKFSNIRFGCGFSKKTQYVATTKKKLLLRMHRSISCRTDHSKLTQNWFQLHKSISYHRDLSKFTHKSDSSYIGAFPAS